MILDTTGGPSGSRTRKRSIEEMTTAVVETAMAAMAARDSTRDIRDTAVDIQKNGTVKETARVAEETETAAGMQLKQPPLLSSTSQRARPRR